MTSTEALFALEGYRIETIQVTDTEVILSAGACAAVAPCPCCGTEATRVRSHYTRMVRDLPCAERHVSLRLRVRRFCCQNPVCHRTIFAERFPTLASPHAQRTLRLRSAQQAMGLALGGEAGARHSRRFHMPTSPATLLRLVRQAALPIAQIILAQFVKTMDRQVFVHPNSFLFHEMLDSGTPIAVICWVVAGTVF